MKLWRYTLLIRFCDEATLLALYHLRGHWSQSRCLSKNFVRQFIEFKIIRSLIKFLTKNFYPHPKVIPGDGHFWGEFAGKKISKKIFFQSCSKWPKTSRKTIKIFQNFCLAQPGDHPRVVVKIFFKKFFLTSYNLAFKKPSNVIFAEIPTLASMSP